MLLKDRVVSTPKSELLKFPGSFNTALASLLLD